jgi:hypothetical protein
MIYPNHSKIHQWILNTYLQRQFSKHFKAIRFIGENNYPNKPALVISNHIGWWDGFWILWFNNKILKKKFHVIMLEKELKKRMFFTKVGAYSIAPGNKSIIASLQLTKNLLSNSKNMVLFFPEGKFHTCHGTPGSFMPGISRILPSKETFSIIFTACLSDYFQHKKPLLNIYFESYLSDDFCNEAQVEKAYKAFYLKCIEKQQQYSNNN